jgi:hypothetical protein
MNYIQQTIVKPYFLDLLKNYNIKTFIFDEISIRIEFFDVNDLSDKDINLIKSDCLNIIFSHENWILIY